MPAVALDVTRARRVAETVRDPELPVLTLAELGVLRDVTIRRGVVLVAVAPTWSGCPATATIRADLRLALAAAGFDQVEVHTVLDPAWTPEQITPAGRRLLHEHGIAPPSGAVSGPVDVVLGRRPAAAVCPRCGSDRTRETSRFGSAPCLSMHVCRECAEPFEKVKDL